MAKDRRGKAGSSKGSVSARASRPRGETVISEGKSYKRLNVGDRIDSRTARKPKPSAVTAEDYADYINSFGGSRPRSARSGTQRTGVSRSRQRIQTRDVQTGFDTVAPGSQIKDVIKRQLPRLRVRLTASLISAIIVGLLAYHIFMGFYVQYKTEVVTISPYLETIDVEGFAIRDEQIVSGNMSNTSVMTLQNGEKISKGDPIVNIFSSEPEARAYERVSEINRELSVLDSMKTATEDGANAVGIINKQLDKKMVELNKASQQRDMSEAVEIKNNISYLLNKRLVAMRQMEDYNARVERLNKEKEELESKYSKQPDTIIAPDSGYFADSCDGYETLLNTSMVGELTLKKLNEIMNKEVSPPEKTIGKLVNSFSWYLACPVSAKDSDFLLSGDTYKLFLPYSEKESIEAVLDRIDKQNGDDTFLALFKCSSLASELCTVRRQPVKIQKCSYEGFAIPKSALHAGVKRVTYKNPHPESEYPRAHLVFVTDITYPSVYAIVAGQIKEKEVSIIYGTDKMVICSPKNGGNYLSLGDTVVITERGLYDGKLLD